MSKNVIIIGGHGKVSLRLAKLISKTHTVISVIRDPDQIKDIENVGATPLVLSLEDSPSSDFAAAFQDRSIDVVVFSAGAGGKGGAERTKKVDYEGALKIFDAIELVENNRPRLLLVSAVDVRSSSITPPWYNDADITMSERVRKAIPAYMEWKYEADKNLVARTAFKWTILRPGGLSDESGTGKASVGRTHITQTIPRDDVALALAALVDRDDAEGLALDIVGGEDPIAEAIEYNVAKRITAWIG